jgi:hypothetical protein
MLLVIWASRAEGNINAAFSKDESNAAFGRVVGVVTRMRAWEYDLDGGVNGGVKNLPPLLPQRATDETGANAAIGAVRDTIVDIWLRRRTSRI